MIERVRKEYADVVDLEWRAYELRPEPVPTLDPDGEYLNTIWNRSVYPMARQRGMTLRLPPVQPRSRRALELAEFARTQERFDEVHRSLFKAFFENGRDLDNIDVLVEIGNSVGLDPEEVRTALGDGIYRERVLHDEREAKELGITGVPTAMVSPADEPLDGAQVITGAQPYEVFRAAVERAREIGE